MRWATCLVLLIVVAPAMAWAPAGESGGDGLYWNKTGTANWTDAANWNYEWLDMNIPGIVVQPGWVPTASDTVVDINNGGTAVINAGETATAVKLTLGAWTTFAINGKRDSGTLEINGGTLNQLTSTFFNVGWRGLGTINMTNGLVNSSGWLTVGGAAESRTNPAIPRGYGIINQSGGTFNNSYWMVVGHVGTGTYNLTNNGVFNFDAPRGLVWYCVGNDIGSSGVVNVNSGGLFHSTGQVDIGRWGYGELNLVDANMSVDGTNGVLFVAVDKSQGAGSVAKGVLNVGGNSNLTVGNGAYGFFVGHTSNPNGECTGIVNQTGGTVYSNTGTVSIGSNSNGTYNLSSGYFHIDGNAIYIGNSHILGETNAGRGWFYQTGGVADANGIVIGNTDGTTGLYSLQNGRLKTTSLNKGAGSANATFAWTGGTLSADSVGFDLTNSAGVLAPGSSAGTTAVTGNFVQTSGGTLQVEIANLASFDTLTATGDITLAGTLEVVALPGYTGHYGDSFVIAQAAGTASAAFSMISPNWEIDVQNGKDVVLSYVPEPATMILLGLGGLAAIRRRRA